MSQCFYKLKMKKIKLKLDTSSTCATKEYQAVVYFQAWGTSNNYCWCFKMKNDIHLDRKEWIGQHQLHDN
jgi:hypothetical protein